MFVASFDITESILVLCIVNSKSKLIVYWKSFTICEDESVCLDVINEIKNVTILDNRVHIIVMKQQIKINHNMSIMQKYIYSYFSTKDFKVKHLSDFFNLSVVRIDYDSSTSDESSTDEQLYVKTCFLETTLIMKEQDEKFRELFEKSDNQELLATNFLRGIGYVQIYPGAKPHWNLLN